MKLPLDTHCLIWALTDSPALNEAVRPAQCGCAMLVLS